jgi:hypothetical protein
LAKRLTATEGGRQAFFMSKWSEGISSFSNGERFGLILISLFLRNSKKCYVYADNLP